MRIFCRLNSTKMYVKPHQNPMAMGFELKSPTPGVSQNQFSTPMPWGMRVGTPWGAAQTLRAGDRYTGLSMTKCNSFFGSYRARYWKVTNFLSQTLKKKYLIFITIKQFKKEGQIFLILYGTNFLDNF